MKQKAGLVRRLEDAPAIVLCVPLYVDGLPSLVIRLMERFEAEDCFAEPFAFPRSLYILIANTNWNRTARLNGIKPGDLYRRL